MYAGGGGGGPVDTCVVPAPAAVEGYVASTSLANSSLNAISLQRAVSAILTPLTSKHTHRTSRSR